MNDLKRTDSGFIRLASQYSVAETLDRLEALLKERGVLVFCRIDFRADAQRAGLALPAEQLLIFGNPKAGTPLMASAPTVGLDLPLKALAWDDAAGKTWIAYNSAAYLIERHQLAPELTRNLEVVVPLIQRAAGA